MGATASPEHPLAGPCELLRVRLPWAGIEPEQVALRLRGQTHAFALIGRWAGGGALIGTDPVAVAPPDADPFRLIENVPAVSDAAGCGRRDQPVGAVGGGWFGYLGYGLGSRIERLDPSPPPGGPTLPSFALAFYDHLLHLDDTGQWWFEALLTPARESLIRSQLELIRAPDEAPRPFDVGRWRFTPDPNGHGLAVAACRDRIDAGDLYQANICQRLSASFLGDPLDLFVTASPRVRPDRAAYLSGPWGAVASLSPELFLERRGRHVRTAPIKGTRPRPSDPAAAERERAELVASAKDRAENQMIVDMARNDLGRVCDYGTVRVDTAAEVRPHAGVWHLVSEVSGELRRGLGDDSLLRATFPPASVTGAPKIAAQNVIAELESTKREIYTGAIGFRSPLAGLELSVAIRSFEFGPAPPPDADNERSEASSKGSGRNVWLGVGGGIVADSDPRAEALECLTKAQPLLRAIDVELPDEIREERGDRKTPLLPPRPLRFGSRPLPRPDPRAGVFETILVVAGRVPHLNRHLSRLAASVAELFGAELPIDLRAEVEEMAAGVGVDPDLRDRARLRVDLRPVGRRMVSRVEVSPLPLRASTRLKPVCLPGGYGPHKWSDRTYLDRLAAEVDPSIPLLCDLDGSVLEAAHASVFALLNGHLVTPPLDGRILPGVGRALILTGESSLPAELTETRAVESPLNLSDLAEAEAFYVVNALSEGPQPAELVMSGAGFM